MTIGSVLPVLIADKGVLSADGAPHLTTNYGDMGVEKVNVGREGLHSPFDKLLTSWDKASLVLFCSNGGYCHDQTVGEV
jgi:hypothetical protein